MTDPLPLPLAPAVTVIHAALLVAVQPQPVPAVTGSTPVKLAGAMLIDVDDSDTVQTGAAWVTVKVLPPTVKVPVRADVPVLAATLYVTEPLPLPDAPAVIVIHAALLTAVHPQPVPALTETTPVKPIDPTLLDVAESVARHTLPACVTVNEFPPAVSVPVLGLVSVLLAAT